MPSNPESKPTTHNYNDLVGLMMLGFQGDGYVIELNLTASHRNIMGSVHGGVLCTLLDTAMVRSVLHRDDENIAAGATLEMKVNFLKSAVSGKLTAIGQMINMTRQTAYVEGRVENDAGELIAKSSGTVMLFNPEN